MDTADFLEHHGIKGMKWGVRRSEAQLARARGEKSKESTDSEDAQSVRAARSKGKSSGTASLSNAELRRINERIQLEQQYKKLTAEQPSFLKANGKKLVNKYVEAEIGRLAQGDLRGTTTYKIGKLIVGSKALPGTKGGDKINLGNVPLKKITKKVSKS